MLMRLKQQKQLRNLYQSQQLCSQQHLIYQYALLLRLAILPSQQYHLRYQKLVRKHQQLTGYQCLLTSLRQQLQYRIIQQNSEILKSQRQLKESELQ